MLYEVITKGTDDEDQEAEAGPEQQLAQPAGRSGHRIGGDEA